MMGTTVLSPKIGINYGSGGRVSYAKAFQMLLTYVEEINSTGTFLYKTRKEAGSNKKKLLKVSAQEFLKMQCCELNKEKKSNQDFSGVILCLLVLVVKLR